MKKNILLLSALLLLSACSGPAVTTEAPVSTAETTAGTIAETTAAAEIDAEKLLCDCLNSYQENILLEFNAAYDENGEYIRIYSETDDPDFVESWYQVEDLYTLDEIKERAGRSLTGKQLEDYLSTLDFNFRTDGGKLFIRDREMSFPYPIADNWEIFTETAEILSRNESSVKIQAKTWDKIYESDYISSFTLELDNGIWKIAEYSLDLPY